MVAWRRRRRSGAGTISSTVKWQHSGVGGTTQQRRWRNDAVVALAEQHNSGVGGTTQQRRPQNHLLHGAAVVKPEQRLGCNGRRRKDLDVVWGCLEKKKIEMVCAAAKGFKVF